MSIHPIRPNGPLNMKQLRSLGVLLAIVLLLMGAFSQLLIVQEDEYRIVRSWTGAVERVIIEAGPSFKLPFVQSTQSLPKHKRVYDGNPNDILTSDQKPIIVDNYTVWQITDPYLFVQNTQSLGNAEQRIDAAVYSTVRNSLGKLPYGEIVSEGKSARTGLTEEVTRLVNEQLVKGQFGITVHDVRLKRTDLPEQNLNGVYNRMKSDRAKIAAEYLSEGDEEAIKIKALTDRDVALLVSEANLKAKQLEAEGEAEASRIYNEAYGIDPEFYSLFRTLESYRTTLKGKPMIVLPISSEYARLLMGR
jgi:membrane protease subunit HflC